VRKKFLKNEIPLLFFFTLIFSISALAQETDVVKVQGRVMSLDFYKKEITVNEKVFALESQTLIKNEKDYSIVMDRLKPEVWVYVIGEYNRNIKKLVAKKIYLLPKYIERRERRQYPFMDEGPTRGR